MKPNKAERQHYDKVAQQGCVICSEYLGIETPQVELHHIREGQGQSQKASCYEVLPLCVLHHRLGGYGVAYHAGRDEWVKNFDLESNILTIVNERAGHVQG